MQLNGNSPERQPLLLAPGPAHLSPKPAASHLSDLASAITSLPLPHLGKGLKFKD